MEGKVSDTSEEDAVKTAGTFNFQPGTGVGVGGRRDHPGPDNKGVLPMRENDVMLYGFVLTEPKIQQRADGSPFATCHVCVARADRDTGDGKRFLKVDDPTILTNNSRLVDEIASWHTNDIVMIKGVLAIRQIRKGSHCTHCGEKNTQEGTLVFVNPIDCKKQGSCNSQEEGLNVLSEYREFSNIIKICGTLCRDPKKVKTKEGLIITRYQIASNRKFRIREDPPEIRADYPWVYSYGENAKEDKLRLRVGAEILVDGCLQARSVPRRAKCETCGEEYTWKDRAMEIVPYEVEYIRGYMTDEMLRAEKEQNVADVKKSIFGVAADIDEYEVEDVD